MRRRQRGFMTVIAVFLLGLLTAAVAVLAMASAADVRRTRTLAADAQLRQLLLAAGADVAARSGAWTEAPTASWSVGVPGELVGYVVKVRATPRSADRVDVTVAAEGGGRHASQRLTWERSDGRWRLVDADANGA